jgi:hypothetical protein
MTPKTFEIRDSMTFIPALAIKLDPGNEQDRYLLARAGYGVTQEAQSQYVLLLKLSGGDGHYDCDPYGWAGSRTMQEAHKHILASFDDLESGAVIDVEHLLGETATAKVSEAVK